MLNKLGNALKKTTDKIANAVFLDKEVVDEIVRELQRALIEADVNVSLVRELSEKIKKGAFDERIKGVEKKEHIVKLLHDELIKILGKKREIELGKRNVWLMVGLYGQGKTTSIGKLASYYSKRGQKVCAIGLDVHRPAASEQLKQVCDKINVKTFIDPNEKDALKIWKKYEKELEKYSLVLVDSAGRDALEENLIDEIEKLKKTIKPTESFLVMGADIGQSAKKQAEAFKKAVDVSGVFITRMDSSAKAGGALTACAETGVGVLFIGTGETSNDIEMFNPESFLSRLLGMGDLQGLIEKVRSAVGDKEIEKAQKRMEEGKFNLRDFQSQLGSMESLGSMDKLMSMVPGLGKVKDKIGEEKLEGQQTRARHWKYAIDSMTEEEIENPEILEKQTSRLGRIAKGSGTTTSDLRALIKQYKLLKEMIKSQSMLGDGNLDQKTMMKIAKKFGKRMRF